ncbi:MAG TPA: carboxypeptidase-like regulatory domain-containing protein [Candidatus Acidoferrum sp.]|nr:carboxypeptidase-like regulatory domain-containing protein [Candidatus Acidoferrum sp.]
MKKTGVFILLASFFAVFSILSQPALAQTVTTGTVIGTVTDPSGAAVLSATVALRSKATNSLATQQTNAAGQYTFANVAPGDYQITVKKDGFRTADVPSLAVEVAKSYTVDVKLELGAASESVTVTMEARVELQTTDAQVGDVIGGEILVRLPTLQRNASELLTLQPGTTPYDTPSTGGFGNRGGTVAGARSDQNSVTLDGIDITDNTVGGGAVANNFIPTGVESLEEFKVGVSNANSTFGRSEGGQIALVSKGGTNQFHGDGYWFHQSDGYNANSWDLNHTANKAAGTTFTRKTPFKDNREGVSIGGPIFHDKTFFFSNYEVRRFPAGQTITRIVPTGTLKQGILQFVDGTGTLRQYNLATSMACGPSGSQACDPRGLGISPTVQALYALDPAGNDTTVGGVDNNNTTGFRGTPTTPQKNDFITFRLDHNFTQKMHFFGKYLYSRNLQTTSNQESILGGKAIAETGSFIRGDGAIGALDYAFNSTTSNTVRYGWIRNRNFAPGLSPSASATQLALAGTNTSAGNIALAPGLAATGFLDVPIDVDTQRARTQGNFQRTKELADDFNKIKGRHNLVAGGDARWLPIIAQRNDKVVGSLASLVAVMDADVGGAQSGSAANRPPACGGAITTFCLASASDTLTWDRLYSATLGIVDNISVLAVRDGSLNPKPFGTPLISNANMQAYNFYAQDTWRMKPSFTLTYGLSYGWQTPPHEAHNQQTFIVDAANNQILTGQSYITQKLQAAQQGQAFNPTIGYLPIANSGRSKIYNTDYGDVGPRVSLAWSPSYSSGLLGSLFGSGKTVVRTGFGIYFDRINNVQSVEIPQLGVGFAQTLVIKSPNCAVAGAAGPNCNTAGGDLGSFGYRVGVDGSIPVPTIPAVSSPIVPSVPFGEALSFSLDPSFKVGRSYSADLTVQKELPGNMLMEVGYIGRFGRDLPNSFDFDSSPYMLKDQTSGQTFAQAFDALEAQIASGTATTSLTAQPWFENQLPGLNALSKAQGGCAGGFANSTQCLVNNNTGAFKNHVVSSLFQSMGLDRRAMGLLPYNSLQVALALFVRTNNDISNYNAATFTLRKRPSHGLQFDLNYTFSRSLDRSGAVQNSASTYQTSFNPNLQYGPSLFDRTHVFNGIFDYDLPAGGGHKLHFSNNIVDKVIAGWYVSGVFRASSGLPRGVFAGNFGGGSFAGSQNLIPTVDPSTFSGGAHFGVTGSSGVGTAGNVNIFANPLAASKDYRFPLLSSDGRDGSGRPIRGLGFWNLDSRLGKVTSFRERFKVEISADFFNIFNHVNFTDPSFNLLSPQTFGVISSELIPANRTQGSRWIELGLRVAF